MSKIIFTPTEQIHVDEVRKVKLIKGSMGIPLLDRKADPIKARVVINDSLIAYGNQGLAVINTLAEAGFYTPDQHKAVKEEYKRMSLTSDLVIGK